MGLVSRSDRNREVNLHELDVTGLDQRAQAGGNSAGAGHNMHTLRGNGLSDREADTLAGAVTTAILPPSSRSTPLETVGGQPGEDRVGDVLPAVVDGQRMAPSLELLQLGDRRGIPVLLQRRSGHHVGYRVVRRAGDQQ